MSRFGTWCAASRNRGTAKNAVARILDYEPTAFRRLVKRRQPSVTWPTPAEYRHNVERRGQSVPADVVEKIRQGRRRSGKRLLLITINGVTRCATDWAAVSGICQGTIANRIRQGWPPEQAVSERPMSPADRAMMARIQRRASAK